MPKSTMQSFGTSARIGHDSSAFYGRKMYEDGDAVEKDPSPDNPVPELDRLYAHSSSSMHELPDNSVHLMVTSPPYNVGKDYDEDMSADEYRHLLREVWRETFRVLVHGGRACINVANIGRRPYVKSAKRIDYCRYDRSWLLDARSDHMEQAGQRGRFLRLGQLAFPVKSRTQGCTRVHPGFLQGRLCPQEAGVRHEAADDRQR